MKDHALRLVVSTVLPLITTACHNTNMNKYIVPVEPCLSQVTGTTEHDTTDATGFSADQVVSALGSRTWSVSWNTDFAVVPTFDSLNATFSLGTDPVQVLSLSSQRYDTGVDTGLSSSCPYSTGLLVPLNVSLYSSDKTLIASGPEFVWAGAVDDEGMKLFGSYNTTITSVFNSTTHYYTAYEMTADTMPDYLTTALEDNVISVGGAGGCDGTVYTYVALINEISTPTLWIGDACVDSTYGLAENAVAGGTLTSP